jgi:hypothetical protein
MDDELDWDCEPVDLDGDYATGDPQIDQLGYNSPLRRGENLTGFTDNGGELRARLRAQSERDRAAREQRRRELAANIEAARQRAAERRGEPVFEANTPPLPQHVARGRAGSTRATGWLVSRGCRGGWIGAVEPGRPAR